MRDSLQPRGAVLSSGWCRLVPFVHDADSRACRRICPQNSFPNFSGNSESNVFNTVIGPYSRFKKYLLEFELRSHPKEAHRARQAAGLLETTNWTSDFFLDTHHWPSVRLRIRVSEEHSPPRMQMQHPWHGVQQYDSPIRFVCSSQGPLPPECRARFITPGREKRKRVMAIFPLALSNSDT